ncbi:MAG: class I SAM-dependent methyltransferase [candidate division Zixibacteria bacterium]|nr:class I SAM-dependent methyltransferase [candidate division Zixibacteria bacterium]
MLTFENVEEKNWVFNTLSEEEILYVMEICSPYGIPGWFTIEDALRLITYIMRSTTGPVRYCELGCWIGKSAATIGSYLKKYRPGSTMTCIDTWQGEKGAYTYVEAKSDNIYNKFLLTMESYGLDDMVESFVLDSTVASRLFNDNSFDVVFIDACHQYEKVLDDIKAWHPKAIKIVAGHDFHSAPGVKQAVLEYYETNFENRGNLWIVKRDVENNSTQSIDRLKSHLISK